MLLFKIILVYMNEAWGLNNQHIYLYFVRGCLNGDLLTGLWGNEWLLH